ncbi:MAG: hypothetical protein IKZ98_03155 [Clostridia bacterium]|nr:hypothetical protein [Clostridia bacterium]
MRNQHVSLYVEWVHRKDIRDICAFLISNGVRDLYVDEDMDQQYIPGQSYSHDHTVFRFSTDQSLPAYELLSALALQPGIYSVGEVLGVF